VALAQDPQVTVPGPRFFIGCRRELPQTARLSAFSSWTFSPCLTCPVVLRLVLHGASVRRSTPAFPKGRVSAMSATSVRLGTLAANGDNARGLTGPRFVGPAAMRVGPVSGHPRSTYSPRQRPARRLGRSGSIAGAGSALLMPPRAPQLCNGHQADAESRFAGRVPRHRPAGDERVSNLPVLLRRQRPSKLGHALAPQLLDEVVDGLPGLSLSRSLGRGPASAPRPGSPSTPSASAAVLARPCARALSSSTRSSNELVTSPSLSRRRAADR
jgi:hypothetical protein